MTRNPSEDLAKGFYHHGVATPVSCPRGVVCASDGEGRDVVLVWLFDHRGGYAILVIDAESGAAQEVPAPFPFEGDAPYASILASNGRYYTHFGSWFSEYDPCTRAFTFTQDTAPQMAMSMTEDDSGRIWSATYPSSGLVSFDPVTHTLTDYGHLYEQDWRQYPRGIAADDSGWVYFAIGFTSGQIIAFDPVSKTATPLLTESERRQGCAGVYRDIDGRVYARPLVDDEAGWMELYRGERRDLAGSPPNAPKPIIAGEQGLRHEEFPSGRKLASLDLIEGTLGVLDPETGRTVEHHYSYTSEGAHVMGVLSAPDGTICGGTAFPMRLFSYSPATDTWENRPAFGQFNTVAAQGDRVFFGSYPTGVLLEWDSSREWVHSERDNPESNPRVLHICNPAIYRPHALLAHPDGRYVIMGGTPAYGYTGGGLLFWDRESETPTLLEHTDILTDHSTMSLAPLPEGKLLGGSTTGPGTGGAKKAEVAELYIIDLESKKVEWHEPLLAGVQSYSDLHVRGDGLVYGMCDRTHFFVLDPSRRRVVHDEDIGEALGPTVWQQGPRIFVAGDEGIVYVLLERGIARINTDPFGITMVEESPVKMVGGGACLDGRIYFVSGSHLYSWEIPATR